MPSRNPEQRLRDVIENIDAIRAFTAGLDRAAFSRDRKTVYAVVRALEIISEAPEFLERHPRIDWAAIAAAGNIYRHEYEAVDETLVWNTVREGLGALRGAIAAELDRLGMA